MKRLIFLLVALGLLIVSGTAYTEDTCLPLTLHLRSDDSDLSNWRAWHAEGICGEHVSIGVIAPDFPERDQVRDLEVAARLIVSPDHATEWNHTTSSLRSAELAITLHAVAPNATIYWFRANLQAQNAEVFRAADYWFSEHDIHIIANLIAYPGFSEDDVNEIRSVMQGATGRGVLWLNAAGNFGNSYYESTLDDSGWGREGWHYFLGVGSGLLQITPVASGRVDVFLSWATPDLTLFLAAYEDIAAQTVFPNSENAYNPALAAQHGYLQVTASGTQPFYLALVNPLHTETSEPVDFRIFVVNGIVDQSTRSTGNSIPSPNDLTEALTIGGAQSNIESTASSRSAALGKPEIWANGFSLLERSEAWGTGFALMRVAGTAALYWSEEPDGDDVDIKTQLLESILNGVFIPRSRSIPIESLFGAVLIVSIVVVSAVVLIISTRARRTSGQITLKNQGDGIMLPPELQASAFLWLLEIGKWASQELGERWKFRRQQATTETPLDDAEQLKSDLPSILESAVKARGRAEVERILERIESQHEIIFLAQSKKDENTKALIINPSLTGIPIENRSLDKKILATLREAESLIAQLGVLEKPNA